MKARSLAIACAVLLAIPARGSAQDVSVGVAVGLSFPVGDLADVTNTGYSFSGDLNLRPRKRLIGTKLEVAFADMNGKVNSGGVRILAGIANAVLNTSLSRDAPYVIAGLGVYNSRRSFHNALTDNSLTDLGLNIGGGLRFNMSGYNTYLEARYHVFLGDDDTGANIQFIPLRFGISF